MANKPETGPVTRTEMLKPDIIHLQYLIVFSDIFPLLLACTHQTAPEYVIMLTNINAKGAFVMEHP